MSQQAAEELRRIRLEMLESQRVCNWCGQRCDSADHLYIHIVLRHMKLNRESGR
jgi:hypothetical protein